MTKKGFSLLELLIYIAMVSVLTTVLVGIFVTINKGAGANNSRTAVDSNLRFAFEKIEQDIHSASAVITPASAGATATTLSLLINGNTTTYSVVGGQLQRQVNSSTPDTVTDASVVVNTTTIPLNFTRLENNNSFFVSTTLASVQIQMNIKYGGTSPDTQYNETKKTTVLMRQFAANLFSCGSNLVYSGQTYATVQIGNQCWFQQNLNVGTMLADASTTPSNNSIVEKWCFNSNLVNNGSGGCGTGSAAGQGGLYTWPEALQLDPSCLTGTCTVGTNQQGICPAGWHIPTDGEIQTLEQFLGMCSGAGAGCSGAVGWRGTDQGTQLLNPSGFGGTFLGYRDTDGNFYNFNARYLFWSATQYSPNFAWNRFLKNTTSTVSRGSYDDRAYGLSVRCLMN